MESFRRTKNIRSKKKFVTASGVVQCANVTIRYIQGFAFALFLLSLMWHVLCGAWCMQVTHPLALSVCFFAFIFPTSARRTFKNIEHARNILKRSALIDWVSIHWRHSSRPHVTSYRARSRWVDPIFANPTKQAVTRNTACDDTFRATLRATLTVLWMPFWRPHDVFLAHRVNLSRYELLDDQFGTPTLALASNTPGLKIYCSDQIAHQYCKHSYSRQVPFINFLCPSQNTMCEKWFSVVACPFVKEDKK